jgi:transposase
MALNAQGLTHKEVGSRLGLSRHVVAGAVRRWKKRGGPYVPPTGRNLATDPATRAAIDAVNASGLADWEVAADVGICASTLSRWRGGATGRPFLVQCVLEYATRE